MFQALFRRAQVTVDNAIGGAINKVLIGIPFAIAAAFATMALYGYLAEQYDARTAQLSLAGGFTLIGLVSGIALRPPAAVSDVEPDEPASDRLDGNEAATRSASGDGLADSIVDKDLATAAVSAIAPLAAPAVMRLAIRNLPLIVALVGAAYIATQYTEPGPGMDDNSTAASA